MRRLFPLLFVVACGACGKKAVDTSAIEWTKSVEAAEAQAAAEKKPVLVFVGAAWDTGAKEMEIRTFADPDVRALAKRYVALSLDATDDEDKGYQRSAQRFRVMGTPSLILYAPDMQRELYRESSFVPPQQLASILTYADAPKPGLDGIRARASYEAVHAMLVDLSERALTHELMDPARLESPAPSCWDRPKPEQESCLHEEEVRNKRITAEHERFEHEVLPALLADSPILSMNLRRWHGNATSWATAGPMTPDQKLGTRNADVGIDVGAGTRLGWGAYRTRHRNMTTPSDTQGDDRLHPGIEVVYRADNYYAKMVVLTDDFRRPRAWR